MQKHSSPHKYIKRMVGQNKTPYYFCSLSNCTHYLTNPAMLEFRTSICWRCNREFQITRANTVLRKPYTTKPICCRDIKLTAVPKAAHMSIEDLKEMMSK